VPAKANLQPARLARFLDLNQPKSRYVECMKQGTFVTLLGLALAASAIAAAASTPPLSPTAQATPVATPSSMASLMPAPSPSPASTMKPN